MDFHPVAWDCGFVILIGIAKCGCDTEETLLRNKGADARQSLVVYCEVRFQTDY